MSNAILRTALVAEVDGYVCVHCHASGPMPHAIDHHATCPVDTASRVLAACPTAPPRPHAS